MATAFFSHPDSLRHLTPPGHPECLDRHEAVTRAIAGPAFSNLIRRDSPLAERADLRRAHPARYLDRIEAAIPAQGRVALDGDTWLSPGSWQAALRGAGGVCAAVDAVLDAEVANAFVASRPPGHHAEAERPMGFCLLSNIAIGALRALHHHGLSRVAVVDFDVHHGNGTEAILWDEPRALFISCHEWPLFPGTGSARDRGGHGNVLNLPLRPGTDGQSMRRAFEDLAFPALQAFRPELLLVSAGFDAHEADPLATLAWDVEDFTWLTQELCRIAAEHCGGRLVSALEGGYDLPALSQAVAAHLAVLMEHSA